MFIVLYAADSLGAVYKCTDTNGRIVYSDTACDTKVDRKTANLKPLAEVKAEQQPVSKITDKVKSFFRNGSNSEQADAAPTGNAAEQRSQKYVCDGRTYCSQMTSCEEATFFINNCPDTKMDGNNDGIPCEKQWCR
ncbi:excalibur calcium-binding domain-containing protein [Methylomonas sp. MO1]|uniref:excalibur calcium-binding domain-containing protein n=1 Tax=Methylomonas sp. MO1 TaxID=3073619 RepID=UPI0028A555AE|nr:excalibur calcium-binding domain-containing protein [Methylomonas sp. MO1]MDT4288897.1 excalibur calcium-binding domain-containing protein [Methylomonas sp. MO1]